MAVFTLLTLGLIVLLVGLAWSVYKQDFARALAYLMGVLGALGLGAAIPGVAPYLPFVRW